MTSTENFERPESSRVIGAYRVLRLLGKGGMSEVYEVTGPRSEARFALKLFTYERDDADVRARFLTEGRLLSRLNHPRVVKVRDYGVDEASARPYFVMDLIQDEKGGVRSLADVLPGTADEEEIGRWYDDLREGLAYIHAQGVIHRDLKLQNVLIGPDGHAVLTDFGISKVVSAKGSAAHPIDTVDTIVKMREGQSLVMGSIGYLAPELEMGVAASPQSDWYALGVVVYRLLTGFWCDARTDVVGTLATYDPVWVRIVPKLLHANPQGRECLSYAAEKRLAAERAELDWENRWLKEKRRGHVARHAARFAALILLLLLAGLVGLLFHQTAERRHWQAQATCALGRSPYVFDEVFKIPAEARADEQTDDQGRVTMPSRADLAQARIDLLVLTQPIFARLADGTLTVEAAMAELGRLKEEFDETASFDRWPEGYMQVGTNEATYWFLDWALSRLESMVSL